MTPALSSQNKILLVAAPQASRSYRANPLSGPTGKRLAALAGLDLPAFRERFDRVTLNATTNGTGAARHNGNGSANGSEDQHAHVNGANPYAHAYPHVEPTFDLEAATAHADQLRQTWRHRKAVLIGHNVMAAFRIPDENSVGGWFKAFEMRPQIEAACVPEINNASDWWHDHRNVENARQFMNRINLGYLCFRRIQPKREPGQSVNGGRTEQYSVDAVAAAIAASDGIDKYAADLLAQETGLACTGETIRNYMKRYPALWELKTQAKAVGLDIAEHNVKRAIRAGDVETSRWLLRSRAAQGRGYELAIEGRMRHEGSIAHAHAHLHASLERIAGQLTDQELDVLEGIYRKLAEAELTPEGAGTLASDDAKAGAVLQIEGACSDVSEDDDGGVGEALQDESE
jgi:hypothetical protein